LNFDIGHTIVGKNNTLSGIDEIQHEFNLLLFIVSRLIQKLIESHSFKEGGKDSDLIFLCLISISVI
jgi:hypothetical protein